MNKVIKVTDDEIFVGMEDGSVVRTEKSNASWDVQIGDNVELFASGDMIILNLVTATRKSDKSKLTNGVFCKIAKLCQKVFPIAFSVLFVMFLTALIVVCSLSKGDKYTGKIYEDGVEFNIVIDFEDDNYLLLTSEYEEWGDKPVRMSETVRYRIDDGKLYMYSTDSEGFIYVGKITSTQIEANGFMGGSYPLELKEKTMITLRTLSAVFMSLFAVLDLASVTVMLLIKNGKIKIEE